MNKELTTKKKKQEQNQKQKRNRSNRKHDMQVKLISLTTAFLSLISEMN